MESDAGHVEPDEQERPELQSGPASKDVMLLLIIAVALINSLLWVYGYALAVFWALLAITAFQLITNRLAVRTLRGKPLTVTLAALCAFSGALVLMPTNHLDRLENEQAAADIRALSSEQPAKLGAALRQASRETLVALREEGFAPAKVELDRRRDAEQERTKARALAIEKTNAPEIAKLERDLSQTPEWAVFDRQKLLRELVTLAPANEEFARQLIGAENAVYLAERNLEAPHKNVSVVSSKPTLGGFGSVYLLDITLKNIGQFPVKDFEVLCRNYAASGTELGSNRGIIYQSIRGGQTKRFREINLGFVNSQAARSGCEVVDAKTGGEI